MSSVRFDRHDDAEDEDDDGDYHEGFDILRHLILRPISNVRSDGLRRCVCVRVCVCGWPDSTIEHGRGGEETADKGPGWCVSGAR